MREYQVWYRGDDDFREFSMVEAETAAEAKQKFIDLLDITIEDDEAEEAARARLGY